MIKVNNLSDRFQVTAGKLQNAVRLHQRHSGENVVCDVAGAINDHVGYDLTESADEFLRLLLGAGRIGVLVFFLTKAKHRQVRQTFEGTQPVSMNFVQLETLLGKDDCCFSEVTDLFFCADAHIAPPMHKK